MSESCLVVPLMSGTFRMTMSTMYFLITLSLKFRIRITIRVSRTGERATADQNAETSRDIRGAVRGSDPDDSEPDARYHRSAGTVPQTHGIVINRAGRPDAQCHDSTTRHI